MGKAFNQGLDKKAENYKEEGVIKLLKDIRDRMVRSIGGNNGGNGTNDDNGDDNGDGNGDDNGHDNGHDEIAETGSIDLSWMNDLQLYRQIASEVFDRYNRDKDSFELFTLRTFIDNINNDSVKNKKDAREEFKTVKKNVKSKGLKQIVKYLDQAIFGYDDDKGKEELKEAEEAEEAEKLDRRFKNFISKIRLESFKEESEEKEKLDTRFKNLISKKRLESFKEYLKEAKYINPQSRLNALRKKLNNLPETSNDETSDETSDDNNDNNDNNGNNDSEDNHISNFVDRVLKKVIKEIVNDDNKDDRDNKNDDNKNDDNKKLLKLSKENADLKKD